MRNRIVLFLLPLCFILLISCGDKKEKFASDDQLASFVDIKVGDYEELSSQAAGILEHRYAQPEGRESYAIIEMDRWYYEYKATGPDIKPVENGKYIDFYPDLTYEYGDNSGTIGTGRFHYSIESGDALLVDNNPRVKPREYKIMIQGPSMVFQGRETYNDHSFQCKLMQDNVNRPKPSES